MTVYFDFSVFVEANNDKKFRKKIMKDANNKVYYYSPAHIEEIANILRSTTDDEKKIKYVEKNLRFLEILTNSNEALFTGEGPVKHIIESPLDTFKRVWNNYELTLVAEEMNRDVLEQRKEIKELFIKKGKLPNNLGQITETEFVNSVYFRDCLKIYRDLISKDPFSKDYMKFSRWEDIKNKEDLINGHIEQLLNFIERTGYYNDPESKYRNRMNDVSHIIYATSCDVFVTFDIKQMMKARAVYYYYGIPTVVAGKEFYANKAIELKQQR